MLKTRKSTRVKLNDLAPSAAPAKLNDEQLRLVVGGLRTQHASSCTLNCDVDCD